MKAEILWNMGPIPGRHSRLITHVRNVSQSTGLSQGKEQREGRAKQAKPTSAGGSQPGELLTDSRRIKQTPLSMFRGGFPDRPSTDWEGGCASDMQAGHTVAAPEAHPVPILELSRAYKDCHWMMKSRVPQITKGPKPPTLQKSLLPQKKHCCQVALLI